MLYSHLTIWTHQGEIWHSLSRPGTRDLSLSVISQHDLRRTIAWAKMHNMTIVDNRL